MVTVACDEHGPMVRDQPMMRWKCAEPGCPAALDDEDARRLSQHDPDAQILVT
jgi:hypothetical protein